MSECFQPMRLKVEGVFLSGVTHWDSVFPTCSLIQ